MDNQNLPFSLPALRALILTGATASLLLTGCGSSSNSEVTSEREVTETETEEEVSTSGRLAIYNQDNASINILDIDSSTVIASQALPGSAPRLYASPESRYAVVIQRDDGQVSFVDSGIHTEEHGDHDHTHVDDPSFLNTPLSGSRPTHFTVHEDMSALFFDGNDGIMSSVTLLNDENIAAGTTSVQLDLANNMHGVAKLIEDQLFVTYRAPEITDTTLPAAVERYSFANDTLTFEQRYTEACPRLHGSAATDAYIVFGCSDGVLAINLGDSNYPAIKMQNPTSLLQDSRIGSIYANHDVAEFVGVAGDQFYVINPNNPAAPYQELSLPQGVSRVTQGFNAHGEIFYILGNDGILYRFNVASNWEAEAPVRISDPINENDIAPAISASKAGDHLFILANNGQQVLEVNSDSGEIEKTINLGFAATRLVWLGVADSHDHDHD